MTMMSLNSGKGDGCDLISPRTKDRNLGVCFTFEKFSSLSVGMKKKGEGSKRMSGFTVCSTFVFFQGLMD